MDTQGRPVEAEKHEEFWCRCGDGQAECDEMRGKVKAALKCGDDTLLSSIVVSLNWRHMFLIEEEPY